MSEQADDDTRRAVARLYEEHPYPDHGVVSSTVARMAKPLVAEQGEGIRILDAGCGTGEQTLGLKRMYPDAEVVGIDLNERSLERAKHYARKHRLDVRFEQVDLLEDPPAGFGRFGVIASVGVLHHLPDPAVALRKLASITAPGAGLLGMVYGRFGKHELFGQRDAIGILAGEDRHRRLVVAPGIRKPALSRALDLLTEALRRRRFGPDLPIVEAARRLVAGRNRAFLADTYTHAQELDYAWCEVAALLDANGWKFGGWAPRSGMPDRPEQVLSGQALRAAEDLSVLELASVHERLVRPANLYFVARRHDSRISS